MKDPERPHVEVIAQLALPLSIEVTVAVSDAISAALEQLGYRNVVVVSPGWRIAATPPGEPHSGPPPAEEGAPAAH